MSGAGSSGGVGSSGWRVLRTLLGRHKALLAIGLAAATVASLATAGATVLTGRGVDAAIDGDRDALNGLVVLLAVLLVVKVVADRGQVLLLRRAAESAVAGLRVEAFDRLNALPISFFERRSSGGLVARLTSDIEQISRLVNLRLADVVAAVVLFVGALAVLGATAPLVAVPALVIVPLFGLTGRWYLRRSPAANRLAREEVATMTGGLGETLAGHRLLEVSGRAEDRLAAWRPASLAVRQTAADAIRLDAMLLARITTSSGVGLGATVAIGGLLVDAGTATVGEVVTVALLLRTVAEACDMVVGWTVEIVAAGAALGRVSELMQTRSDLPEPAAPVPLPRSGALRVTGLRFAYRADEPLFEGVDLELQPGQRTAVVGSSGSGKSTLAVLLSRLRDPEAGAVSFGGVDLRDAALADVRRRIVVLPQEAYVFRGSLLDNVLVVRPEAGRDAAEEALRQVGAHDILSAHPAGLGGDVTNDALSDGERQLVSLARIALSDAAVVFLDEATAHIDASLAAVADRAWRRLAADRIVVTIAHQLDTALRADRVIVLAGGAIVDDGPPDVLARGSGAFATLLQQAPEDL